MPVRSHRAWSHASAPAAPIPPATFAPAVYDPECVLRCPRCGRRLRVHYDVVHYERYWVRFCETERCPYWHSPALGPGNRYPPPSVPDPNQPRLEGF